MCEDTDVFNSVNRNGLSTQPWGIPVVSWMGVFPLQTDKSLRQEVINPEKSVSF